LVYAVLILIALGTRSIGDFRPSQYALAEAVVLGWLWLRQEVWFAQRPARLLLWVTLIPVLGIYLHAEFLIKAAILFGAVLLWRRGEDTRRRAAAEWTLRGLAAYAIIYTVFLLWPVTFNFVRIFSYWHSGLFSALAPAGLSLGPTATGYPVILAGIVFIVALQWFSSKASWVNTLAGVILLFIGQVLFWAIAYSLGLKVASWIPLTKAVYIHLSIFYLLWTLAAVRVISWIHPPDIAGIAAVERIKKPALVVLGVLAVCAVLFAGPFTPASGGKGKRVLLLNADKLDVRIPNFSKYGDRSAGMFGMLPRFCRGLGYDVRLANVTPEIFDSIDVCIFANLIDSLPDWQRDSVFSFVRRGGGLLALADHTGYNAIRGPTNELTGPMGLMVNFDTAIPLRRSWYGQMRYLPHRITQSARTHDEMEVWLGGSVEPLPGSLPLVVGVHTYSDPGDSANSERSYLGNLEYDPGEPLGDIIIAAAAHYGRGRAVIFGDTSPFQNGALVMSHRLAARTLGWLSSGGTPLWDGLRTWGFPLVLILALGAGFVLLRRRLSAMAYLVLLPVCSISLWNLYPAGEPETWFNEEMPPAFIDASHGQFFDLMGWEKYSVGGLELNLMRNGYQPQVRKTWHPGMLKKARLLIIARPTQPITAAEIDELLPFIESGGWVLVAAGYEEHAAVDELLAAFGLKIENVPLGRAEGLGLEEKPTFARVYQLSGTDPGMQVVCTASQLPVVASVRCGQGGLALIGDPVFLFNDNLENRDEDYHVENIRFFHALMKTTSGAWGQVGEPNP
jgi:hypothetical protein